MRTKSSPAMEDYLKGLYLLAVESPDEDERAVGTSELAARMGVSAASATNMLKKLSAAGLAVHIPYRGARLTTTGRRIALEVVRHHRLLETYLAEALGVPWDQVHAEAEVLEHVLSEELEERIARMLGDPTADPHGHPIPGRDLEMPASSAQSLWDIEEGAAVTIERVPDSHAGGLRFLADAGIRPGASVTVVGRGPVGGPLFVRVGTGSDVNAVSKELAEDVWVA